MTPNPMPQFVVGQRYRRDQIHAVVGGDLQSYLPYVGGTVVCGCFHPDANVNPGAPAIVLFGDGPIVEQMAQSVADQSSPIPVFLFRSNNEWEYRGRYRCLGLERDPIAIQDAIAAFPQRGVIRGILFFKRVGD